MAKGPITPQQSRSEGPQNVGCQRRATYPTTPSVLYCEILFVLTKAFKYSTMTAELTAMVLLSTCFRTDSESLLFSSARKACDLDTGHTLFNSAIPFSCSTLFIVLAQTCLKQHNIHAMAYSTVATMLGSCTSRDMMTNGCQLTFLHQWDHPALVCASAATFPSV